MNLASSHGYADLAAGDRTACDDFVRDQYEGLFRWFHWLTSDPHRAADLTQETFAGFWHSLQRTVPSTLPRVWLYSIGRNVWRKHCRKRKRKQLEQAELPDEPVGVNQPEPFESVEQQESAAVLRRHVAELPEELREALTLRVWQELDYKQIGLIQGTTPEQARWRCWRAREILRTRMKSWQLQEESHGA